jgi:hypothetical protein
MTLSDCYAYRRESTEAIAECRRRQVADPKYVCVWQSWEHAYQMRLDSLARAILRKRADPAIIVTEVPASKMNGKSVWLGDDR